MEQQNNNLTQPTSVQIKRPKVVTVFCILGFISVLFALGVLFIPSAHQFLIQQYGSLFVPIALLLIVPDFIGLIGYWKMRKWGVYVYTAGSAISFLYELISGISPGVEYIFPLVIIAVGFMNFKKMS